MNIPALGARANRSFVFQQLNSDQVQSAPGVLERAYVVVMLFFISGAVTSLLNAQVSTIDAEVVLPQDNVVWVSMLSRGMNYIALLLLFRCRKNLFRAMRSNMLLAILPVLALLSVTWSVAPKVTLSSSVGLIAASIFGAYFGLRFTFLQQLNMLAKALALIAVASLLIVILMPSYGISHGIHLGDWRGAFGQKNRLGMFMSIGTLVFWSLLRARPSERRPRIIIGLITCAFLLVMSGSKTGVIVLILLSSLLACRRVLTWRTKSVVMLMGMTGLLLVLGARVFVQNAPVLFKLLGRDPTLSGRLGLWVAVAFKIAQRPWLGYGFQSFWQGPYGESRSIWALLGWTVPYAHNGFLDLLLDLGLVGLVAFLVGYVLALIRARKYLLFSPMPPEAVWPLAFLLFTFLYNLTETCLIGRNGIFWVLLVATVARLSMTQPGRIVGT